MKRILSLLILLIVGSTSAHAKCFPWEIGAIAYSSRTHAATVVSSKQAADFLCELTVEIHGIRLDGFSDEKSLCKASAKSKVALKTRTYCCDEPPQCAVGHKLVFVKRGKGGLIGAEITKGGTDSMAAMIDATIKRPWPGQNYPALPPIPQEVRINAIREIAGSVGIRSAYASLNPATERNVTWFAGIEKLEQEKAKWSLQTALCHPSGDVQIRAVRALGGLKDPESLPFLLAFAASMAGMVSGSENATLHGLLHHELVKALSSITGENLGATARWQQDTKAVQEAVRRTRAWMRKR